MRRFFSAAFPIVDVYKRQLPYQGSALPLSYRSLPANRGAEGAARAGFAIGVRPPQAKLERGRCPRYRDFMNKKANPADAEKAARLAAALRENLKRRKAQARARAGKPAIKAPAGPKPEPGPERD